MFKPEGQSIKEKIGVGIEKQGKQSAKQMRLKYVRIHGEPELITLNEINSFN